MFEDKGSDERREGSTHTRGAQPLPILRPGALASISRTPTRDRSLERLIEDVLRKLIRTFPHVGRWHLTDAVQAAAVHILEKFGRVPSKPGYFYKSAVNALIDSLRKVSRSRVSALDTVPEEILTDPHAPPPDRLELAGEERMRISIEKALIDWLDELSAEDRAMIELHMYGNSKTAIATRLEVTAHRVKTRQKKLMRQLAARLERLDGKQGRLDALSLLIERLAVKVSLLLMLLIHAFE